jgi:hypothetical protein
MPCKIAGGVQDADDIDPVAVNLHENDMGTGAIPSNTPANVITPQREGRTENEPIQGTFDLAQIEFSSLFAPDLRGLPPDI